MQITTGIRSILSVPAVYNLVQNLVGARGNRREFVEQYVKPKDGEALLDVGCGTGDVLEALPSSIVYYGCDISPEYIRVARARYGHRGTFRDEALTHALLATLPKFDIVMVQFVLHHMSDTEVVTILELARASMKPGARLLSIDPAFVDGQSPIARFIISLDRGQCVRRPEDYRALAATVFSRADVTVRHDLNRIPYSHAILVCRD